MQSQLQKDFKKWTRPTKGQQEAGNYFKPRLSFSGLEIAIENPAGTTRSGENEDGTKWSTKMKAHYGYVVGSEGADGDEVDAFIGSDLSSDKVFVVHQAVYDDWESWDEDKVMLGFSDADEAKQAYLEHYDDDRFFGDMTSMSLDDFKAKVKVSNGGMIKSLSLIDLSGMSCECENKTLELITKAISEDGDTGIWSAHESDFISSLIELFTERGLLRIESVKNSLDSWLSGHEFSKVAFAAQRPGMAPVWSEEELSLVKLYLESLPPGKWTLEDYDYLVQYVFQRYMPVGEMMSDAEWLITRAAMMGKAQAHMGRISSSTADTVIAALPVTVPYAISHFSLSMAETQILEFAKLHSAEMIVALSDSARHSIKNVIIEHMNEKALGVESATPGRLQQRLFDEFATMNRDWRRIALTEAVEASNQGVIASLPVGTKVKRMEVYNGACGFCKTLDGRVFNVVSPDDPDKNGDTDVWVGKTNYGRSSSPRKRTEDGLVMRTPSEMWWAAAGAQHPHCRGEWVPLLDNLKDDKFSLWLKQRLGIKAGLSLKEWSLTHASF